MRMPLRVVLAASLLSLPLFAQDLVGVAWTGGVYALDSHTGAATLLGTGLFGQNALAVDGSGTLWSTHRTGLPSTPPWTYDVTVVNPQTGAATVVYPAVDLRGMAGDGTSTMWGIQDGPSDLLVTIDLGTGFVTTVGPTFRS